MHTEVGYEKFQQEAPIILKEGIYGWSATEPILGKTRIGAGGVTMEFDTAAVLKKLKEAAKAHAEHVPKQAAIGAGVALLGGATSLYRRFTKYKYF